MALFASAPAGAATVDCPQALAPAVGCNVAVAENNLVDINIILLTASIKLDVPGLP